jgi:FixJ family two-component response regulator
MLQTRNTVFVVDDDAPLLRSIGRLLRQHGYETMLFNSAEALRRHGKLDQAFCIVLDINLGDASGIELRRWLAQSALELAIIFITGQDNHATRAAAIQSDCIAYLTKPFPATSLIEAIQTASDAPANGAAARDQSWPDAGYPWPTL